MLFISHSSKDRTEANKLHGLLLGKGYAPMQLFLDSDEQSGIEAGTQWEQVLYERLKTCQALVVLCSPHWKASQWCFAELVYAKMSGKEIFPVVITDGDIGSVVSKHQAIFVARDGDKAYEQLFTALEARHLSPKDHLPWPHPDLRDAHGNSDDCPFPGLLAFDERYAAVYFGREQEIQTVLEQLNEMRRKGEPRLLMIVGGSGSGKSSLLKAGVLPRLQHRTANADWLVLPTLRYGDLAHGENAFFHELAENIVSAYPPNATDVPKRQILRRQLANPDVQQAAETFWEAAHDLAIAFGFKDATVLLAVDQFEELLTLSSGAMAAKFLRFLKACCERPNRRLLLVGTMRSDYLDLYEHHDAALTAPLFQPWRLAPLPRARIGDVIVKPAARVHVQIANDLVETLKQDTPSGDALPLLAFTLRELYRRRVDGRQLELGEYTALGGMEGAIKQAADKIIYKDALSPDVEAAVRLSFVKYLAQVNDKDEFARLTSNWHDLPEHARPILERFIDERLLVKSLRNGQVLVEIAHEAMFRCWDILRDWLRTSADILRWRRDVRRDQESDQQNGRRWNGLRPAQLEIARDWPGHRRNELTDAEITWIRQGIRRKWKRRGAVTAVVLIFFALAVIASHQSSKARESRDAAVNSLNTQLSMFTKPIELTGKIAAAVTKRQTVEVYQFFDELTSSDTPFVRTPSIIEAIAHLGDAIEKWDADEKISWNKIEEPSSESVRQAALDFAKNVRAAWESQKMTSKARSMTRDLIVRPTYKRAIQVTRKIAHGPPRQLDKDEFEQLYWGELVFLETTKVEENMVIFRRTLLGNPGDKQNELKKIAENLKVACDEALLLSPTKGE